jgi:hypothetical protein
MERSYAGRIEPFVCKQYKFDHGMVSSGTALWQSICANTYVFVYLNQVVHTQNASSIELAVFDALAVFGFTITSLSPAVEIVISSPSQLDAVVYITPNTLGIAHLTKSLDSTKARVLNLSNRPSYPTSSSMQACVLNEALPPEINGYVSVLVGSSDPECYPLSFQVSTVLWKSYTTDCQKPTLLVSFLNWTFSLITSSTNPLAEMMIGVPSDALRLAVLDTLYKVTCQGRAILQPNSPPGVWIAETGVQYSCPFGPAACPGSPTGRGCGAGYEVAVFKCFFYVFVLIVIFRVIL